MKLLKRTLIIAALFTPGIVNSAMLRFDVSATTSSLLGDIGLLSGSYFVVDTSVPDTSQDNSSALFANSIVGGRVETMDPFVGHEITEIGDTNSGSIIATNNETNTTWTIPVVNPTTNQSAEMSINFSGTELSLNLLDNFSFYNDNYIGGSITANSTTIPFNTFSVSDATPSPVPLPPTFYLMASSLVLLLWRSSLSFSNIRTLMTSS